MVHKNSYGHIEINVQNVHPPLPPPLFRPPYEWYPWIVPMFFNINLIVFIVSMYINNCPAHSHNCIGAHILQRFAFENVHENPLLGPSTDTLEKMGALDGEKVIQGGQQWRILTCMWLHAGVFHIFVNMLSLLGVGIRLEQEFGFVRIGLIYILSGIGGSMLSALFVRKTISVGASGALFGLLGAMFSELLTNWTIYRNKMETLTTLILLILINLLIGILPYVDNFTHLGGFVTGFFLGFIFLIRPRFKWTNQTIGPFGYYGQQRRSRYKLYQYIFLILSIIALTVMFIIGLVFLFRKVDGNDYCPWCHYLSCIPTPLWSCNAKCNSTRSGDQLNLICLSNGKSKSYMLPDDNNMLLVRELCANLCI